MSNYKAWQSVPEISEKSFSCWKCSNRVAGNRGYYSATNPRKCIYICPNCAAPNYFNANAEQIPGSKFGNKVEFLPDEINKAYNESRDCFSVSAFTGSSLLSRKILMNVAVEKGADKNKPFAYYVDWLAENNFLPPDGKEWVDHVRTIGNQGTHEIQAVAQEDAMELISFCEMLLKFVYEFPERMKRKTQSSASE